MDESSPAGVGGGPGYVRALIGGACRVECGGGGWDAAARAIPARPGVVVLEDVGGRTVLLGASADARAFVLKRCAAPGEGKRADLAGVVRAALIVPVASGFEADLVYLAMARERTPAAYRTLMARWRQWVVRLDPDDEFPEAACLGLSDAKGYSPEFLMGPVGEMWAPRLAEAVVDAFDLCRYPSILKQAPRGVACAYKEMGRCPGPCDGTEAMASFRERLRRALACVGRRPEDRGAELLAEMKLAAGESRFEDAAALKKVLGRVDALDSSGLKGVSTMDRYRHVVVAPSGSAGSARLFAWAGGSLRRDVEAGVADVARVAEVMEAAGAEPVRLSGTNDEEEAVSVLARWAAKSGPKRRVRVVRLGGVNDQQAIIDAIKGATRRGRAGSAEDEIEETEHGYSGDPRA